MRILVLSALVAATALAGCVGNATEPVAPASLPAGAPAMGEAAASASALAWEGYVRVGAALEIPAHAGSTEPLVAPLWRSGFVLDVSEAPRDVQVVLEWTGVDASRIQLMVHAPHEEDSHGWTEYTTEFSSEKRQCLRVPAEDIFPGAWQLMVHSLAAANVDFTITALLEGGAAEILEGPHGHSNEELADMQIYKRESLPCGEAASPQ